MHTGIMDFSFSKVQEASVPINGAFQLLLNGVRTLPIPYGASSQEVHHLACTLTDMHGVFFSTIVCVHLIIDDLMMIVSTLCSLCTT